MIGGKVSKPATGGAFGSVTAGAWGAERPRNGDHGVLRIVFMIAQHARCVNLFCDQGPTG
jgi:hypothetical protein